MLINLVTVDINTSFALTEPIDYFNLYNFFVQTLNCEGVGKVTEFKAVPGCGLSCTVSHTENMLGVTDSDIINRRHSQMSFVVVIDGVPPGNDADTIPGV